jgi:hypothetical protein
MLCSIAATRSIDLEVTQTSCALPMRLSFLQLFGSILAFVLAGTPLVAYLWEALNRLMAGHFEGRQVAIALVSTILLAALLRLLARSLWQWEQPSPETPASGRAP